MLSPLGFNGLFNSNHRTESQDGQTGRGVRRGEDEEKGVKMKRKGVGGRKEGEEGQGYEKTRMKEESRQRNK